MADGGLVAVPLVTLVPLVFLGDSFFGDVGLVVDGLPFILGCFGALVDDLGCFGVVGHRCTIGGEFDGLITNSTIQKKWRVFNKLTIHTGT